MEIIKDGEMDQDLIVLPNAVFSVKASIKK